MKPTSKTLALASFLWLVALPVAGSAPASAENAQQKKINLGRMQIALHLHSSGFSRMFRGEAYRSPSEIAKLVEVSVLPGSRAENGATRQALRWSIPGGVTGPSLGGEATIWSYPPGSRHEGLLLLFATAKN